MKHAAIVFLFWATGSGQEFPFAGRWVPRLPENQEILQQLVLSYEPGPGGRFRCGDRTGTLYTLAVDGTPSPAAAPETMASMEKHAEREYSVKVWSGERTISTESVTVSEDGQTLTRRVTHYQTGGKMRNEIRTYSREKEENQPEVSPEGARKSGPAPVEPIAGRWRWLEGEKKLEQSPQVITITEGASLTLSSPLHEITVHPGGKEAEIAFRGPASQKLKASAQRPGPGHLSIAVRGNGKPLWNLDFKLEAGAKTMAVTATQADRPGRTQVIYERQ